MPDDGAPPAPPAGPGASPAPRPIVGREGRRRAAALGKGPEAAYRELRKLYQGEEQRLERRSRALSRGRLLTFGVGVAGVVAVVAQAAAPGAPAPAVAAAGFGLFGLLAAAHARVLARQREAAELVRINDEALARLARSWGALPLPAPPSGAAAEPLARDLDLFGSASLLHLLGTVHTPPGRTTLARWLLAAAPPEEVGRRQAAVAELCERLALRQELEQRARVCEKAAPDVEPFLAWAEGEPWLLARPALLWGARLLAAIGVALLIAWLAGLLPFSAWFGAFVVNLLLGHAAGREMAPIFARVDARSAELGGYAGVFAVLGGARFATPLLGEQLAATAGGGEPAHRAMERLARRVVLADLRHSGLLHAALQGLVLWDFHALWLLERWQVGPGRHVRRWLDALGVIEALAALGTLAFDEPGWAFPEVATEAPPAFAAEGLGHPLLPPSQRVVNDVTLGPPGSFLFVTGSNMSGKSTLLRAIGLNAVLAQAGGPVCAAALTLPPLALGTSILVEDSLARGVSFFMAELERLKAIVDAADGQRREGGPRLLFLLDEVLRGTNATERRIAVERVLAHLIAAGAIGAVSTHDLGLAEAPALAAAARPVHFRETLHPGGHPPMTFDYRLRPGLAPTTNALKLLEMVGLGG
jgi:MutS domain V